jgi:predicted nucleic acid-binding protein
MIALDTNILARYLLNDDEVQSAEAEKLLAGGESFYVPLTVWLELAWVLDCYDCSASEIAKAVRHLLGLPNLQTSEVVALLRALDWHEQGMDFADALHLALSGRATSLASFDRRLAKVARTLGVQPPVHEPGRP